MLILDFALLYFVLPCVAFSTVENIYGKVEQKR